MSDLILEFNQTKQEIEAVMKGMEEYASKPSEEITKEVIAHHKDLDMKMTSLYAKRDALARLIEFKKEEKEDPARIDRFGFEAFGKYGIERAKEQTTYFQALFAVHNGQQLKKEEAEMLAPRADMAGARSSVGSQGGFLLPSQMLTDFNNKIFRADAILSRVDKYVVSATHITWPYDDEQNTAEGVRAKWNVESQASVVSTPKLGKNEATLNFFDILIPIHDNMMDDSNFAGQFFSNKAQKKLTKELQNHILGNKANNIGEKTVFGILGSQNGNIIVVTKESGQAANTINKENISNMTARCMSADEPYSLVGSKNGTKIWCMSVGAAAKVFNIAGGDAVESPVAVDKARGLLNGVPMTITDVNAALGSQGDILLADFSQYMFFARGMMPSIEISAECKFLERNTVLRVSLRCAGKPAKPVYNTTLGGGEAYGPFVTLEAR